MSFECEVKNKRRMYKVEIHKKRERMLEDYYKLMENTRMKECNKEAKLKKLRRKIDELYGDYIEEEAFCEGECKYGQDDCYYLIKN